jgi:hypothetical protein
VIIRNNATSGGNPGSFYVSIRNILITCCGWKLANSPGFLRFVALLHLFWGYERKIPLPGILKPFPAVALWGFIADPDGLRLDPKRSE